MKKAILIFLLVLLVTGIGKAFGEDESLIDNNGVFIKSDELELGVSVVDLNDYKKSSINLPRDEVDDIFLTMGGKQYQIELIIVNVPWKGKIRKIVAIEVVGETVVDEMEEKE